MGNDHAADKSRKNLWDLIDAVLVINLDDRPERWHKLLAEAEGLIPEGKLHRISAVRGSDLSGYAKKPWFRGNRRDATWAARGGCVLAHRRALQTARDAGWDTVLVLEDDVTFTPALRDNCESLGAALESSTWDICYLGYTDPSPPWGYLAPLNHDAFLARVFGCNCAHSYIVKEAPRNWILNHLPDFPQIWSWLARHRAVDRWYLRTLGRHFHVTATSPSLINQTPGYSDILVKETDYLAEGTHVVAIPSDVISSYPYLSNGLRCIQSRISEAYDFLRSIVKRFRGF
jgi:hypothetical protein